MIEYPGGVLFLRGYGFAGRNRPVICAIKNITELIRKEENEHGSKCSYSVTAGSTER